MSSGIKSISNKVAKISNSNVVRFSSNLLLTILLVLMWNQAFAADDPLAGTDASLIATLGAGGTGRKFIYLIECIAAIAAYIKTKNIMMFGGVVGIAVFLNVIFKMAAIG